MTKIIFTFFILSFFLFIVGSCNNKPKEEIIIAIQPFEDLPENYSNYVFKELKKVYPHVELKKSIPFPSTAFYSKRNRYRADTIIKYLSQETSNDYVTIGLTTKDISTRKDNIEDWGVMGLNYRPGNACVVSTFRLTKSKILAQLFKVSVHELGHTRGLDHCEVKTCFMRSANGGNPTDEEKEFCPQCKKVLLDAGWKLN